MSLHNPSPPLLIFFFFFNDPATTEIYTLPLHDALPIFRLALEEADAEYDDVARLPQKGVPAQMHFLEGKSRGRLPLDRKSTRLNSSHLVISYAVFCLKKKKKEINLYYPSITKSQNILLL